MFWCWSLVITFCGLICPSFGQTCQPRAVSLPLKKYTLETQSEARGLSMQIGGPSVQQMVLVANPLVLVDPVLQRRDAYLEIDGTMPPTYMAHKAGFAKATGALRSVLPTVAVNTIAQDQNRRESAETFGA